ncbi:bifunctional riboflavin kinase/FAD synthetase [Paralimibaculum aggregatum]|uniref:Riboflavin biosynthesis protein n=1 Tax=Paralimibaculum aggregatum TaxID=3036245 RepID=A0ABQ6LDI6_9RHOB|nr:bifunctional riboflavin kinase/FAD synthetase [Limibaculum sp. NKW23]GMG81423.1 bifunctional riboflavin kinase/FAD synthetase [Limibaculum sp. NKW23]
MDVIRGWHGSEAGEGSARTCGASAALGNFDGVHRGHQALLAAARKAAPGAPLAVVSFEPHPRRFFQPDAAPFRLTSAEARPRVLASLGVERLYALPFDRALAAMSPEAFARDVLAEGLGLGHVVVGADFHFGKGRAGTAQMLAELGQRFGFGVTIEPMRGGPGGAFSSTAIRQALRTGHPVAAARALGRWHGISGRVAQGDRRGRELGYPTANLDFGEQLVPAFGVYAARVTVHEGPHAGRHDGVASIGERPTFGYNKPNFEVHLFDFAGDLYGAEITAELIAFLRGEERFDSIAALVAQMDRDSVEARAALAAAGEPWREEGDLR